MCGILGLWAPTGALGPKQANAFCQALNEVAHRGPDGAGVWARGSSRRKWKAGGVAGAIEALVAHEGGGPHVWFGHRRLSIIDLSEAADQPMSVGLFEIIFNGEIYNYIELRDELSRCGHRFTTKSDTEVIVRAYEQWGPDCFARFNGMWAIALWDEHRKELILSRDRMGVKPLYYAEIAGKLCWASEIKQLRLLQREWGGPNGWNPFRLFEFVAEAKLHHAEETLYQGIYTFRPGHFCVLTADGGRGLANTVRGLQKPYWDFPKQHTALSEKELGFEEAAAKLRELLESAVSLRLRSDVAVGSALSGGLDSSAIVSMMARLNPLEQKTFSAVFPGHAIDERKFAESVIAGTRIAGVFVEPSLDGLQQSLPRLLHHQDGPVVSTSMFAQWEVFRAARAHGVPVMLDGQGADELFAGYEGFLKAYLRSVHQSRGLAAASWEGAQFVANHPRYFDAERVMRKLAALRMGRTEGALGWFANVAKAHIRDWLELVASQGDSFRLGHREAYYSDPLREALYRACVCTSLPSLLTYEDRNSMASSVESRTPFLDYRVVEFAFRCPAAYHVRGGMRKALLREALKGVIPELIRTRKDKIGFATPEKDWQKPLVDQLKSRATEQCDSSIFDSRAIAKTLCGATPRDPMQIWRLISAVLAETVYKI